MDETEYQGILSELIRSSHADERLSQFQTAITAHQYVRLYRELHRRVPRGSRVLDWGAGSGHFSYYLARRGYRGSAFSLDEPPRICGSLPPDSYSFTGGDMANPVALPFADDSFDAVVSVGVLEHVRETGGNEADSMREIRRVLRPGGVFLCFHFPNRYSWIDAAARSVGRWAHEYRYTASEIRSLAASTQLELLGMERYAVLPRNVWSWGLPHRFGSSFAVARLYDRVDTVLSAILGPICQNYMFVARKSEDTSGSERRAS